MRVLFLLKERITENIKYVRDFGILNCQVGGALKSELDAAPNPYIFRVLIQTVFLLK